MKFDFKILEDLFVTGTRNEYEDLLMQQCFDIVGVFIAAVDLKGNITLVNKKAEEMLEYPKDQIIGKSLIERFIIEERKHRTLDLFDQVIQEKISYSETTKYYLSSRTGKKLIIEARNIAIRNQNGNMLGILISGENVAGYIDQQRNLQDDINLYQIMANSVPDINLFLFDTDMRFILAEGNEMRNNGVSCDYFEEKSLKELPDDKIKKIWTPLFISALKGQEISSEYEYNLSQYRITVLPIINKKDQVYLGIAITQNITREKHLAQNLQKSKDEAELANKSKTEFLARVSHEIRTPLNAILGFTEQLGQTRLSKKQKEFLNIIDVSSEHLLSLINDILVISKIEAHELSFDLGPFKIKQVIEFVYRALSGKAKDKKLHLTYNIDKNLDRILIGDSFRLRQVLINMLNNAIKFTEKGSVHLSCSQKKETQDEVWIDFNITDTGIGISPDKLELIFEEFRQADNNISKRYGGTGLGLTICKNLIEMQNGSLSVTSKEGSGSSFKFVLPYRKSKEDDIILSDQGVLDGEKIKGRKIMLVDDDSVNRLLGETILKKTNCDLDLVSNGKEAIEKLKHQLYDVVLLDIHLPDMSGIDIARFIRKSKHGNSTKIIAITAAALRRDIKSYYKVGINDFLIKPFREINLFNKICEVLQIKNPSAVESKAEIILKEELSPKPYDLTELVQMSGNDKAFKVKMLGTFIRNTENAIRNFQKYLQEENWEQIGETAHKILPSYRHLRAEYMVDKLMELKSRTLLFPDYISVPPLLMQTIKDMKNFVHRLQNEIRK